MRDALESGDHSMLVIWNSREVRSIAHCQTSVCNAATMRVLLGLQLFEPVGDGDALRLTKRGVALARLSRQRRANFQRFLRKEGRA